MRIVPVFLFALLVSASVYAAEPETKLIAATTPLIDADADSDVSVTDEVEQRTITLPGLRECKVDKDCTIIEGICESAEPVNVERATVKQEANRKARAVAECVPPTPDRTFAVVGAACFENECVIQKRTR